MLTTAELENLRSLKDDTAEAGETGRGQDAGRSAFILSRERYEPGEGILIDPREG